MRAALRHRRAPLVAMMLAVAIGAALVAACGGLLETALRLDAPPNRLAGAAVTVRGAEHTTLAAADGRRSQQVTLTERPDLPADASSRVTRVPGVANVRAVPDLQALAVTAAPGVNAPALRARIAASLRGLPVDVLAGDDRGRAEATGVAASRLKLILFSAIFGGLALVVMAILLAAVIDLAVGQRRREIGLLRTIGATPQQVREAVISRTLRPALVAAAAGACAGPPLGRLLFDELRDGRVVPHVLALRQSPLAIIAGALAALAAARISAGFAARRAARAPLADALGEVETPGGGVGPVRFALAALLAAAAGTNAVMTFFMPAENATATGGGISLAGALACALVAPVIVSRATRRLRPWAQRRGRFTAKLGIDNVSARPHRSAALMIPALLVSAVALSNVYQTTTQAHATRDAVLGNLTKDPHGTLTLSNAWIEHPADGSHRIDPWMLLGADPSALDPDTEHGSISALRGNAVALPDGMADKLDLHVGDRVGLVLGDGARVRPRVAALIGGRAVVIPSALGAAHAPARAPAALRFELDRSLRVDAWITFAVVGVIVAYAALALVTSLVAALKGRRRELALLRLAGATRAQLWQMLATEGLALAGVGAGVGIVLAICGVVPVAIASGALLPSGPAWFLFALLGVIAGLVLVPTGAVLTRIHHQRKVSDALI